MLLSSSVLFGAISARVCASNSTEQRDIVNMRIATTLSVVNLGDLILYLTGETDAMDPIALLQAFYSRADLRDLTDRRLRKTIFDEDEVFRIVGVSRVEMISPVAARIVDKIIFRIVAGTFDRPSGLVDKTIHVRSRHI